ncbi:hypothetical protein FACS18942_09850 [Planctomycetales bacterium]|nr:hypothetical protein FACS18942_09850 [Planctomycetales bacterium]GHT35656.1 hypothetical protein FACS189427_05440 [Planctomycetales bacterium]
MLRILHVFTWCYVVLLTLLLWLPDPRAILFGWGPGEETAGYAHVVTFALLAFLIELDRVKRNRFFWETLLIGYVFLTEIVQEILPIRCFDIADIIQDIAGLFIGFYIAGIVKPALFPFLIFRWFEKR